MIVERFMYKYHTKKGINFEMFYDEMKIEVAKDTGGDFL